MEDAQKHIDDIRLQTGKKQIDAVFRLGRQGDADALRFLLELYDAAVSWIEWDQGERDAPPDEIFAAENCYEIVAAIRELFRSALFSPLTPPAGALLFETLDQGGPASSEIALLGLMAVCKRDDQASAPFQQEVASALSRYMRTRLPPENEADHLRVLSLRTAAALDRFVPPDDIAAWIQPDRAEVNAAVLGLMSRFGSPSIQKQALDRILADRHFLELSSWEQEAALALAPGQTAQDGVSPEWEDVWAFSLKSAFPAVRIKAVQSFAPGRLQPDQAEDLLHDPDPFFRKALIRLMAENDSDKWRNILLDRLEKERKSPMAQTAILDALFAYENQRKTIAARILDRETVETLASDDVRNKAARLFLPALLADIVADPRTSPLETILRYARTETDFPLDKQTTGQVLEKLAGDPPDPESRDVLIALLGLSQEKAAVRWMIEALENELETGGAGFFDLLLESLARTRDPGVAKPLLAWLRSDEAPFGKKMLMARALQRLSLSKNLLNKLRKHVGSMGDSDAELALEIFAIIIRQPWEAQQEIVHDIAVGKNKAIKTRFIEALAREPDPGDDRLYYHFITNNTDPRLNLRLINSLSRMHQTRLSENFAKLIEKQGNDFSPLASFVNHLDMVLTDDDKTYFQETFFGDSLLAFKDRLGQYCMGGSIENFLFEFFSQKQLADILKQSADIRIPRNKTEIIHEILKTFGLKQYREPGGIHCAIRRVKNLIRRYEKNRNLPELAKGAVLEIFMEAEHKAKELLYFYSALLFGEDECLFRLKEAREGKPILESPDLSRLTFGTALQVIRRLEKRVRDDKGLQKRLKGHLARPNMLEPSILKEFERIVAIRNRIVHPSKENAAGADALQESGEKGIELTAGLFDKLLEKQCYPDVIAVDQFVRNHYGVDYWVCHMDDDFEPVQKNIITERKLDASVNYFICPRDAENPSLMFYPALIEKR